MTQGRCARLAGQVAIITGGASGIGRATALLFAREGADVVIADVQSDAGQAVAAEIAAAGDSARFVRCDVSDPVACAGLINAALAIRGRIEVLINNAAVILSKSVIDTTPEEWAHVLGVNLTGVYLCSHFALPHFLRQGRGVIVNTASPHAFATGRTIAAYAAAKGGVVSLTRQMALDYGRHGIRVNCVVPGAIDTPMLRADVQAGSDPASNVRGWSEKQPIGRVGTPEDIAKVMLWLCTEEAAFVLGAPVIADGGLLAQLLP